MRECHDTRPACIPPSLPLLPPCPRAHVLCTAGEYDLDTYYLPGAHAARMLHRVRRAERMLLSYERTGWLEDEPARVTGRSEIRPAAELGPIILCLDTSGSMRGARETVAKVRRAARTRDGRVGMCVGGGCREVPVAAMHACVTAWGCGRRGR